MSSTKSKSWQSPRNGLSMGEISYICLSHVETALQACKIA